MCVPWFLFLIGRTVVDITRTVTWAIFLANASCRGDTIVSRVSSTSSESPTPEIVTLAPAAPPQLRPQSLPEEAQRHTQTERMAANAAQPAQDFGTASTRGRAGMAGGAAHADQGLGSMDFQAPRQRVPRTTTPAAIHGTLGGGYNAHAREASPGPGASSSLPSIDPNGRFATTYRPGRGHLAGFEASLSRGELPPESRELVGDLGSRYTPDVSLAADKAIAWQVDLERGQISPSGGSTHMRIALRSTERAATARPPMSVHVVLDVSNSMAGASIENARRAAQDLVGRLEPTDHFSLVAFGGTANVRVPEGLVGPRRAQILQVIAGLQLEGGTNISGGLELGYAEAARGPQTPEWVKLVMLLSDGRPNSGDTRPEAMRAMAAGAFQAGVQTSAFGVGDDYDGPLMSGIAEQGGGGYYYVRDSQGIAASLGIELESRLQPVAQAVEIRVRLRPDIRLTQTYGSRRLDEAEAAAVRTQELAVDEQTARRDHIARDRHHDVDGGMRFFIPGFARNDRHVILLGMDVPAGLGERPLATIELRYKDRITRRNVTDELPIRVRYANSDAASVATVNTSVQSTVQGFDAGEALVRASSLIGNSRNDEAIAVLNERASLLRVAAETLHEPRLASDAARLDHMRTLIGGGGAMSQPLALALLLNTSGRGLLH
jgi:Ca-activated chloride channel homolog